LQHQLRDLRKTLDVISDGHLVLLVASHSVCVHLLLIYTAPFASIMSSSYQ
jgi:hypothetical protein